MKLMPGLLLTLTAFPGCERAPLAVKSTTPAARAGIPCPVVEIHDGESLTVMMDGKPVKVRIEGIDAPENGQPHSNGSRTALTMLTIRRTVRIAMTGTDRDGLTLARVYAGEADVGWEMIRQGLAWHFLRYNKDDDLAAAEKSARTERAGLWADAQPVPPWEWREGGRVTP